MTMNFHTRMMKCELAKAMTYESELQHHLSKALTMADRPNDAFPSKAMKKEAIRHCQEAMSVLHGALQNWLLDNRKDGEQFNERQSEQYYWQDGCHKWTLKVEAMFVEFPDFIERAREVTDHYLWIKQMEVIAPTKAQALEDRVDEVVGDYFKRMSAQVGEHVALTELFGKLRVQASWHWVQGAHGTNFIRRMYFMNHQRTALGVILAALDELDRKGLLEKISASK